MKIGNYRQVKYSLLSSTGPVPLSGPASSADKEINLSMAATLHEMRLAPDVQSQVVVDCQALVEQDLAGESHTANIFRKLSGYGAPRHPTATTGITIKPWTAFPGGKHSLRD